MNIEDEKLLAKEVLDCLSIICPHAILAGGAPRDWYMGNGCNDFDFYFNLDPDSTIGSSIKQLERVLPIGMVKVKEQDVHTSIMYKHMKSLRKIHSYTYKGRDIQLIQLRKLHDVFKAVSNMSCSICMIWWKGNDVVPTVDFMLTYKTKMMYLNKEYSWSDPHPKKMRERFSSYSCGTEEQAGNIAVRKFMEG
jgi:hypothetical protein